MGENLVAYVANKVFLVRPDDRVLFLISSKSGLLDVPGGRMQADERDMHKALQREVEEEIGYTLPLKGERVFGISFWKAGDDVEVCGHGYRVDVASEISIRLSHEHTDFLWARASEVMERNMKPGFKKLVELYRQQFEQDYPTYEGGV